MPQRLPFYKQLDSMDCGATCLRMIAKYYGRYYSLDYLREITYLDREGVSLLGISDAAEHIGLRTLGVMVPFEKLIDNLPLPCIAYWEQWHFVVVYSVTKKMVSIADPAIGIRRLTKEEFLRGWVSSSEDGQDVGVLLLMEATPDFYAKEGEVVNKKGMIYVFSYITKY